MHHSHCSRSSTPLLLVVAAVYAYTADRVANAADQPNIIVILADDMGYSDIGCYGGEIETPTLDRLAEGGLRYSQFYNTARCCPTRASLLTGLYPHQAGIGHMMVDRGHDGYRGELNRRCLTIAEALRPAGYRTYMAGKWHVTKSVRNDEPGAMHNWPLNRGFDRFYGTIHGAGSFWDPNSLTRDDTLVSPFADDQYVPEKDSPAGGPFYYTDAISDHATRFIRDHRGDHRDEPFFMYVAYTAAHWPMHARPRDIAKYAGRYNDGYRPVREARLAKLKSLGLVSDEQAMSAQAGDWGRVEDRAWESAGMEVYAAMVDSMDQGIGRVVETLKETNQFENTLVFYMQDNGGCAEGLGRSPRKNESFRNGPRADDPTMEPLAKTYLQPDMIPKQTRDGYPVRFGVEAVPGPADTYIAYGRGWANVSNTPFREYKHWVHEGGISTPLIAHWPEQIDRVGEIDSTPSHLIDIMATCVDVAAATYPGERDGQSLHPLAGVSLAPTFGDPDGDLGRDTLYWEHEGNRAIRRGDWKLVAKGEEGPWELYDLLQDRAEQSDLAKERPELVSELSAAWTEWAAASNVLPLGTWRAPKKAKPVKKKSNKKGE